MQNAQTAAVSEFCMSHYTRFWYDRFLPFCLQVGCLCKQSQLMHTNLMHTNRAALDQQCYLVDDKAEIQTDERSEN